MSDHEIIGEAAEPPVCVATNHDALRVEIGYWRGVLASHKEVNAGKGNAISLTTSGYDALLGVLASVDEALTQTALPSPKSVSGVAGTDTA